MKATKIFIIGVIILVGIILLIGIYHKEDNKNFMNGTSITNTSIIEPIAKSGIEISMKAQDVGINALVPFEVGKKYLYETVPTVTPEGQHKFAREIVKVVGKEKINGKEYYKVVKNVTFYLVNYNDSPEKQLEFSYTLWFDKNTGHCISKLMNPLNFSDSDLPATHSSIFAYWMLGLKDNLRFNIEFEGVDNGVPIHDICEFEVLGKEKINDRECFKIKEVWKSAKNGRIWYINYYWVDVKERILVKKVSYSENIKVHDMNLIRANDS